jgi:hypothetical protein
MQHIHVHTHNHHRRNNIQYVNRDEYVRYLIIYNNIIYQCVHHKLINV